MTESRLWHDQGSTKPCRESRLRQDYGRCIRPLARAELGYWVQEKVSTMAVEPIEQSPVGVTVKLPDNVFEAPV